MSSRRAIPRADAGISLQKPVAERITLPRAGRKPLSFKGVLLSRHDWSGPEGEAETLALWARADGRLAVSLRFDGIGDAAIAADLAAAMAFVEGLCSPVAGEIKAEPGGAVALLGRLEGWMAQAAGRARLAREAGEALADWKTALAAHEGQGDEA